MSDVVSLGLDQLPQYSHVRSVTAARIVDYGAFLHMRETVDVRVQVAGRDGPVWVEVPIETFRSGGYMPLEGGVDYVVREADGSVSLMPGAAFEARFAPANVGSQDQQQPQQLEHQEPGPSGPGEQASPPG